MDSGSMKSCKLGHLSTPELAISHLSSLQLYPKLEYLY
uniref:Uncharacterized protein n=1 Tax=Rhizophora mucronata TaxID=61149 RepID=A0A2P2P371_RHIMU